jgi:hypothetical protein
MSVATVDWYWHREVGYAISYATYLPARVAGSCVTTPGRALDPLVYMQARDKTKFGC